MTTFRMYREMSVVLMAGLLTAAMPRSAQAADPVRFDVNDVSFLFPAPTKAADVANLISIEETLPDGSSIWPTAVFQKVLDTAASVQVADATNTLSIQVNPEFRNAANWRIAGIRVDPGAPGTHASVVAASPVGVSPQIRLIVQPVTVVGSAVQIHDVTAHLVFGFGKTPDPAGKNAAFEPVVADLKALKAKLKAKGIETAGELRVHPGFAQSEFLPELRTFLTNHLRQARLGAIAFMGVHGGVEPWIFFAMVKGPSGEFVRAPNRSLGTSLEQLVSFGPASKPVLPVPNNQTFGSGVGLSTSLLFGPAINLNAAVFPTATDARIKSVKHRDIPNIIANPQISHFFNADCISCHTESTRRAAHKLESHVGAFQFKRPAGISGPSKALVPTNRWNVRNFGWFPLASQKETVTMRTANEAAESADFVNRVYLADASAGSTTPAPAAPAAVVAGQDAPVSQALTLIMTIKSPDDAKQLKALLAEMVKVPAKNPIIIGMNKLGIVHDARFVFIGDEKLLVITTYDGDFAQYINLFTKELAPVFNALLKHVKDAPTKPVQEDPQAFLKFVQDNDQPSVGVLYSGYPTLSVQDIRGLLLKAQEAAGVPTNTPAGQ